MKKERAIEIIEEHVESLSKFEAYLAEKDDCEYLHEISEEREAYRMAADVLRQVWKIYDGK